MVTSVASATPRARVRASRTPKQNPMASARMTCMSRSPIRSRVGGRDEVAEAWPHSQPDEPASGSPIENRVSAKGARPGRLLRLGVAEDLLQLSEVFAKPFATLRRDAAGRLRAIRDEIFVDFDQAVFGEHVEVPAQVAVGEVAQRLQFAEDESVGPSHER